MLRRISLVGTILALGACADGPGSSDWEKRGQTVAVTYPEGAAAPAAPSSAAKAPLRNIGARCTGSMQITGGSGYACLR
ncbi:MAG: hypothetical protein DI533_14240 [Cereibacter sphaeroides]|uniref:Lipoprotein n=1 Tax=Cereibacter sphaeroides TaxID=1063 RepID=A0A2W5S9L1_CERSP|nr:MAG: hypothetical protein DI533_14240 [Cereibacter sphaeroides]